MHANRWDSFTTAELKILAAWAHESAENRELDTRDLRRQLRGEIDRRQVEKFGEPIQTGDPQRSRATRRHAT